MNPQMEFNEIYANHSYPFYNQEFCYNPNASISTLILHITNNMGNFHNDLIYCNPNITINHFNEINIYEIMNGIHSKTFQTHCPVIEHIFDKYKFVHYDISSLSCNPYLSLKFIQKNIDILDARLLSTNPNLTIDFIQKYPNKQWEYSYFSKNGKFYMNDVLKHPEIPWNYAALSWNNNIMPEDILKNPQIPWTPEQVSWNPNITLDFFEKYFIEGNRPYDMKYISMSAGITMSDIESSMNKYNWNLNWVAENPNLTYDFFNKYIIDLSRFVLFRNEYNCWDIHLAKNLFGYHPYFIRKNLESKIIPIQTKFIEKYWNPKYSLCRNRLLKQFNNLNQQIINHSINRSIKNIN